VIKFFPVDCCHHPIEFPFIPRGQKGGQTTTFQWILIQLASAERQSIVKEFCFHLRLFFPVGVGDGMVTETGNFPLWHAKLDGFLKAHSSWHFPGGLGKYAGNTSQQNEVSKSKEKA